VGRVGCQGDIIVFVALGVREMDVPGARRVTGLFNVKNRPELVEFPAATIWM